MTPSKTPSCGDQSQNYQSTRKRSPENRNKSNLKSPKLKPVHRKFSDGEILQDYKVLERKTRKQLGKPRIYLKISSRFCLIFFATYSKVKNSITLS